MPVGTANIDTIDQMVSHEGREYRVHGVQLIGTTMVYFRAWEPTAPGSGHTTITSFGESWTPGSWGTVVSRGLPADIAAMVPGSDERIDACHARRAALEAESIAAVLAAFPWLADGTRHDGGEVWTTTDSVVAHHADAEAF